MSACLCPRMSRQPALPISIFLADSLHSQARSTLRSDFLIANTTPGYDKARLATKREKEVISSFSIKNPNSRKRPSTDRQRRSFIHLVFISDTIPPIVRLGISASSKLFSLYNAFSDNGYDCPSRPKSDQKIA
jgi:hypothetical protein